MKLKVLFTDSEGTEELFVRDCEIESGRCDLVRFGLEFEAREFATGDSDLAPMLAMLNELVEVGDLESFQAVA